MSANESKLVGALYFDTNVLDQGWPTLSVATTNIISVARTLGIRTIFPEPVLTELDNHWEQRMEDNLKNTDSLIPKINAWLVTPIPYPIPDWLQMKENYKDRQPSLLKEWKVTVAPYPDLQIEELFEHAVRRQLLFAEQGRNFQDVIVFLSAVQHAKRESINSAALVSNDKVFKEREHHLIEYAAMRGIMVRLWSAKDAERDINELLDAATKAGYIRRRQLAAEAISAVLPQIERNIEASLNSPSFLGLCRVHFTVADEVDVPIFDEQPDRDKPVRLSAVLKGTIETSITQHFKVRRSADGSFTAQGILFPQPPEYLKPPGTYPFQVSAYLAAKFNGNSYSDIRLGNFSYTF